MEDTRTGNAGNETAAATNGYGSAAQNATSIYKKYIDQVLVYARKHNIPETVYQKTRDMATEIALKMREYSDAMAGKGSVSTVSILVPHFTLLEKLRKNNPEKYKQLVYFATIYPTLGYDDRQAQLVSFFKDF